MARDGRHRGGNAAVVIGLGRFGGQVALSLEKLGCEVLAIDSDPPTVQRWSQRLTHVVEADATDDIALRQLGVAEFSRVVVGIGDDLEASVLSVLALNEIGVEEIWANATSRKHARILSSIGARHVIYPEAEVGIRAAHLITSKVLDFIEFEDDFAIAKTYAPPDVLDRSLANSGLRARYGVTVVGVKSPGQKFEFAGPHTVVHRNAVLIVAGGSEQITRFAAAT